MQIESRYHIYQEIHPERLYHIYAGDLWVVYNAVVWNFLCLCLCGVSSCMIVSMYDSVMWSGSGEWSSSVDVVRQRQHDVFLPDQTWDSMVRKLKFCPLVVVVSPTYFVSTWNSTPPRLIVDSLPHRTKKWRTNKTVAWFKKFYLVPTMRSDLLLFWLHWRDHQILKLKNKPTFTQDGRKLLLQGCLWCRQ